MASEDLPANGHGGPADCDKPALRRTLRAARTAFVAGLDTARRADLEAALAVQLDTHLPTGCVAGYHACGSEIAALSSRVSLFPRIVAGTSLAFHESRLTVARRSGGAAILEPPDDAPARDPDIVIVPLLAVDRRGNRLGQGGGHYDRTLAALRARRRVFVVGVAWDMQVVAALPADPWDAALDALATPSQWLTFPPRPPISPR